MHLPPGDGKRPGGSCMTSRSVRFTVRGMTGVSAIPVLSMTGLPPAAFADALGSSFRSFGFAIIRDHGIDGGLIARAWRLTEALFALPDAAKRRYLLPGGAGQRGYTPFGQETAKGARAADLKEFWHVGYEAEPGEPLPEGMAPNIWPDGLPDFRDCFMELYAAFAASGQQLLAAIALHLGLESGWFEGPTRQGNSILRLLHYPPLDGAPNAEGAIRAEAHEDINLITLLLGAEEAGLQLLSRDGRWIDVDPPAGAMVVNIGDMLQRLTNHVLPSTTHRVINPSKERQARPRYSMPFFLHLRPDFVIDALPQCISTDNPRHDPPIAARDYLEERLREIGLLTA